MSPSMENTPSVIRSFLPGNSLEGLQFRFRALYIPMCEDVNFRLGKPASVNNAGVIQFIRNNVVFRSEYGRDSAGIRGKSRLENYACLDILKCGDRCSSCMWRLMVPEIVAHRAGSRPEPLGRIDGRLHQRG